MWVFEPTTLASLAPHSNHLSKPLVFLSLSHRLWTVSQEKKKKKLILPVSQWGAFLKKLLSDWNHDNTPGSALTTPLRPEQSRTTWKSPVRSKGHWPCSLSLSTDDCAWRLQFSFQWALEPVSWHHALGLQSSTDVCERRLVPSAAQSDKKRKRVEILWLPPPLPRLLGSEWRVDVLTRLSQTGRASPPLLCGVLILMLRYMKGNRMQPPATHHHQ